MTSIPESDQVNNYNSFAEIYNTENESSLENAYYERPATLRLAGDVAGRKILDAGCGAGPLSKELRDRGALVSGFDKSAGMLEIARKRLGDDVDLRVHDLAEPLPYADGEFDDVIASLSLHYLKDWGPTLAELRRVLRPGGRLIASVNHPTADYCIQRMSGHRPNYFEVYRDVGEFEMGGTTIQLAFWNRPLHKMTDDFTAAGFRIARISEPQPDEAGRELFPDVFYLLETAPSFLFFVLEAE
ncbi:class I SAM-dependent methyltransferase [Actinoalloteichus hymeniacidonis]|uniref:Methyltransferase family protein n=1 Tax=Actinoalloteichus hymeniacidonis TaxID=340345 RepID=A0AAC9HMJ8_9PSEU|nr:class I SAM-dependent methyltransferase [Actinoalloteichus hymeniacidonis]AOS62059.1 methyltransferase family protein [Actinoalloteichus hymeniacidonis]MBB5909919.1 ubiquinone/menaquinone biosynthesis C-methylase UbiE [Actinoalloteichus hymeniacidonis]